MCLLGAGKMNALAQAPALQPWGPGSDPQHSCKKPEKPAFLGQGGPGVGKICSTGLLGLGGHQSKLTERQVQWQA